MGHLTLAWLGVPQVLRDGGALSFRTRKCLALLIFLSAEGGRQTREKLTALFWPDSDEERGRTMLRRTLAFLRESLGEADAAAAPHLRVERDALSFDFTSDFDGDLQVVEQAAIEKTADLDLLRRAAGLVRGDFLEGFTLSDAPAFDEWASLQREHWHQRVRRIFDALTQAQSEAGHAEEAIETVTRWLALDGMNDDAYQRLMRLHLARGDRPAALRAYQACEVMLAREFNTEPSADMKALAARARAGAGPSRSVRTPRASAAHAEMLLPLAGRESEFRRLSELYHLAHSELPQVVTLEGDAGIGKTRLATEFLDWARADGAIVWQGRAFETGGRLPYQPLVEALRGFFAQDKEWRTGLPAIWLAEVSRLLPELHEQHAGDLAPVNDEAAAQTRLFEAIARLSEAVAARSTLVVFVDDAQWADAAAFDLLLYLRRRWQEMRARVLLVLNLRSESLATEPRLGQWLSNLAREQHLVRLTLKPLTLEETRQVVEALGESGPDESSRLADWLFTETRGQPFYISEMFNVMRESGLITPAPSAQGRWQINLATTDRTTLRAIVPPGVRELIRSQLARLTPSAAALLAAGAVLGQNFDFDTLCRVAKIGDDETLPALDELSSHHLIVSKEATPEYNFAHDKIRDIVYTEAGEARRRVLHRRAIEVLASMGAPAGELAHHAIAAGQNQEVFRFSLAAGDEALQLLAVRDALAHYEKALQCVAHADAPDAVFHLHTQMGKAYEFVNENEKARGVYEQMLQLARNSHIPKQECAALNRLANLAGETHGDFEAVATLLHEALDVAQRGGDRQGWAETEWSLAHNDFYSGRLDSAHAHGAQALALAGELDLPELVARSMSVLAYVAAARLDWTECESFAEQARLLYATLGNPVREADCLSLLATALILTGRPRQGIDAAHIAYEMSRRVDNLRGQTMSTLNWAHGLLDIGDYESALKMAREGVASARIVNDIPELIFILVELGVILRALGDVDAAHVAHLEAEELNHVFPVELFSQTIADELCADCVAGEDWDRALTYAEQARTSHDRGSVPFSGLTPHYRVESLLHAGRTAQARADLEQPGTPVDATPRYRVGYLRAQAALDMACQKPDQAVNHLNEAANLADEMGLIDELWQILAALNEVHHMLGATRLTHTQRDLARAAQLVQSIAGRITDQSLRRDFLSTPRIHRVLNRHAT